MTEERELLTDSSLKVSSSKPVVNHMTEVKGQTYHYYVEYPPADLISHKIFKHFSPEDMSESVNSGNSCKMQDPPTRP